MKKFFKPVSMFLVIAILLTSLPFQAFADEKSTSAPVQPPQQNSEPIQANPNSQIIGEIKEKRESNIKYFLKDDLTYEAAIYQEPVHYMANGKWEDIDNTLIAKKDENNNDIYENKSNSYKVKIAKTTSSNKLVTVQKDKYELSWNIKSIKDASVKLANPNTSNLKALSKNDSIKTLTKLSSTVQYSGIQDNVDLEYVLNSSVVKENIILNKKVSNPVYNVEISVKNLVAELQQDNTIVFYDAKDKSKKIFSMDAPYMKDSKGAQSYDIQVALNESQVGYMMTLSPSHTWLDSPERVYPVTIDPTVETDQDPTKIQDTYVASGTPTTSYSTAASLRVGKSSNGVNRAYVKVPLLPLSSSDMVVSAYLNLNMRTAKSMYRMVNLYEVTSSWTPATLNWNNQPIPTPSSVYVQDMMDVANAWPYSWNITPLAKQWYSTKVNNGVMLAFDDESIADYCDFISADDSANSTKLPMAVITFTGYAGIESYWSYQTQSVGRAGTGYVNNYNGNLVFVHEDVSTTGNRMPMSLRHVFNSRHIYVSAPVNNIGYGLGWMLNYNQTVSPLALQDVYGSRYYIYMDDDGTMHYFKETGSNTNIYNDESGLGLTLTFNASDATCTISDKGDNKLVFKDFTGTNKYQLNLIQDDNTQDGNINAIRINYSNVGSTGLKITSIQDGAGRTTTLNYDTATGNLTTIKDPAGRVTTYRYTDDTLTQIEYPDRKISTYKYTPSKNMTDAINFDQYKVKYGYYTVNPYRIKSTLESNNDVTLGKEITLEYGNNQTMVTDISNVNNQQQTTYQFNDRGNTTSIKDKEGYVTTLDYHFVYPNKVTLETPLRKPSMNYLKNHNMESSTDWALVSEAGSTASGAISTEDKYIGNQSLKINKSNTVGSHSYQQNISLVKGKTYTLSGYIKTSNISGENGKGAELMVKYQNSTGVWTKLKESKYINNTRDWQRADTTFTIPANAASGNVIICAAVDGETGTAFFDCMQLEEGTLSNAYNLIENGDFSYGTTTPSFWSKTESNTTDKLETPADITDYPKGLSNQAYKIVGSQDNGCRLKQTLNISGRKGDVFDIGGWAKGFGVNFNANGSYEIQVNLEGATTSEWHELRFNYGIPDWQYQSLGFIAQYDYTKITIYISYQYNKNIVYFDGLHLYREGGNIYNYDGNGNLLNYSNRSGYSSSYQYDGKNDAIRYMDYKNNITNTTYINHDPDVITSEEGVVTDYDYDKYGNITATFVGDDTTFIKTSNEYTEDGNYLKKNNDASGNTVSYEIDPIKGTLQEFTDADGKTTHYEYDENTDKLKNVYYTWPTNPEVRTENSYSYVDKAGNATDYLQKITQNGFDYTLDYDKLGNSTGVWVGAQKLVTNRFESRTGKLLDITYGNGQQIGFDYDSLNRIKGQKYNGDTRYTYDYDATGKIGFINDLRNAIGYRYIYDLAGLLSSIEDTKGNITSYKYDQNQSIAQFNEKINGEVYSTTFDYNDDNRPSSVKWGNNEVLYNYIEIDSTPVTLGRLTDSKVMIDGMVKYSTTYSYEAGVNSPSSNRLASISNAGNDIRYTYTKNGYIDTVTMGGKKIKYYYDDLGQLIRDDNEITNETTINTYDLAGNIKTKAVYECATESTPTNLNKTYVYSYDTVWKDKLTSIDDGTGPNTLAYDEIGNLTNDTKYDYTWEEGRQLSSMNKVSGGLTINFKYNADGIRTEKMVNGVTTKYHLAGDQVTYETNGADNIYYTYGADGNLISMNLNGAEYYYIRNGQNDIIGLFDGAGTQVVSYTYDAWGKLISTDGSLKDTVGVKNPYRYRGYRYDTETGLYYLQSRYYNPEWGRFINADRIIGVQGFLLSHNMFTYCLNNPVMYEDPNGDIIPFILAIIATAPEWAPVVAGIGAAALGGVAGGWALGTSIKSKADSKPVAVPIEKTKNDVKKGKYYLTSINTDGSVNVYLWTQMDEKSAALNMKNRIDVYTFISEDAWALTWEGGGGPSGLTPDLHHTKPNEAYHWHPTLIKDIKGNRPHIFFGTRNIHFIGYK